MKGHESIQSAWQLPIDFGGFSAAPAMKTLAREDTSKSERAIRSRCGSSRSEIVSSAGGGTN
jgi:hypothetical protein